MVLVQVVASAAPAPEIDALFQTTEGWNGADGSHSVDLGGGKILWTYADTIVGKIADGKRTDATIVNNTVGIQERGKVTFTVKRDAAGKPEALIVPADGKGWYWIQSGMVSAGKLYLFMSQIDKDKGDGVFAFKQIGEWIGEIPNYKENPLKWKVNQVKIPFADYSKPRGLTFGGGVAEKGGDFYVYGTEAGKILTARVPKKSVLDFDKWRFFDGTNWTLDWRLAAGKAKDFADNCSCTYDSKLKKWLLVYTENGLSSKIMVRSGANPWGPWSEPEVAYDSPEMRRDKNLFCYAAMAHGVLQKPGELVISYEVNSFDFWQIFRDPTLYWPQFVRVKLKTS